MKAIAPHEPAPVNLRTLHCEAMRGNGLAEGLYTVQGRGHSAYVITLGFQNPCQRLSEKRVGYVDGPEDSIGH